MDLAKKAAAEKACELVEDGMIIGLGTGSTAEYAIRRLGQMVRDGLRIKGVPTSRHTQRLAEIVKIPIIPYEEFLAKEWDKDSGASIDIDIDGADCVDPEFRLIKGGGGAHTREKNIATASRLFCCIVDNSKIVPKLVGSFPIPVEVIPEYYREVMARLKKFGEVKLRETGGKVFITDNSNYVVDVSPTVGEPDRLEVDINEIPGVVDNGFFTKRRPEMVFVGYPDGSVKVLERGE